MSKQSKKVYVGLSGGVDSSVSALLLKNEGYDVTGVFIKIWHPDFLNCNWKEEMRDAMRICAKLDISFKTIDLSKEYEESVIEYMISEYKIGRTPNPDVMCNKYIKFGKFFDWAINDGADFVATGHYAQVEDGKFLKSVDQEKDQTYFLWTLTKKQLEKTLFPIGHILKSEVRKLANKKENDLITANKKDSQGLCFVGHVDMKDFLKNYLDTKKGNVLNEDGEVIGEHQGALLYTIGERHGFTISKKGIEDRAMYIISKDIEKNTVTVSEEKLLISNDSKNNNKIKLKDLNILNSNSSEQESGLEVDVRLRYRQVLKRAILKVCEGVNTGTLHFKESVEKSPSGQSAVFYVGNECIGGGIIA